MPRDLAYVAAMCLIALLAHSGCRTVWVHENWYEGRFEEDFNACRAQEAQQRADFMTQTREEICEQTSDDRRVCREVIRGGVLNITPWKHCMLARGWTTEVGIRTHISTRERTRWPEAQVPALRGRSPELECAILPLWLGEDGRP